MIIVLHVRMRDREILVGMWREEVALGVGSEVFCDRQDVEDDRNNVQVAPESGAESRGCIHKDCRDTRTKEFAQVLETVSANRSDQSSLRDKPYLSREVLQRADDVLDDGSGDLRLAGPLLEAQRRLREIGAVKKM